MSRGRAKKGLLRSFPDSFVMKIREKEAPPSEISGSKDTMKAYPSVAQAAETSPMDLQFKRLSSSFTHRICSLTIKYTDVKALSDELTIKLAPIEEPVTIGARMGIGLKSLFYSKQFMPKRGDALEISFGHSVNTLAAYHRLSMHIGMIKMGIFYVNEIIYSKSEVVINANSSLDDDVNKEQYTNLWKKPIKLKPNGPLVTKDTNIVVRTNNEYNFKEVIKEVSKSLNLKGGSLIDEDLGKHLIKTVQENQSGKDFLSQEAEKLNAILKIKNDKIYLVKKWEMPINDSSFNTNLPLHGKNKASNTIILNRGDFVDYEINDSSRSDYHTVKAVWRLLASGESDSNVFCTTKYPTQRCDGSLEWDSVFTLPGIYPSEEKALLAAHQKLSECVDNTDIFKGEILLEPQLVVGCQIRLEKFVKFRGNKEKEILDELSVLSVTHSFGNSGFVTSFEASASMNISRKYFCLGSEPTKVKRLSPDEMKEQDACGIKINE